VLAAPPLPPGRELAGRHRLDPGRDVAAGRAYRFRHDADRHAADYRLNRGRVNDPRRPVGTIAIKDRSVPVRCGRAV
jgi:hypothetical protein